MRPFVLISVAPVYDLRKLVAYDDLLHSITAARADQPTSVSLHISGAREIYIGVGIEDSDAVTIEEDDDRLFALR